MRDVFIVRDGQRTGDLRPVAQHFMYGQRTHRDTCGHRFAFHQFHYYVVGTDVVKRADVGMIQ
jgi:hypothetical protein